MGLDSLQCLMEGSRAETGNVDGDSPSTGYTVGLKCEAQGRALHCRRAGQGRGGGRTLAKPATMYGMAQYSAVLYTQLAGGIIGQCGSIGTNPAVCIERQYGQELK